MIFMLTVVADTGALLSLELSGLFDVCKRHFKIIIGEKIADELRMISLTNDELGMAAKNVMGKVAVLKAGKIFDKGEDETLELLAEVKADILISDDIEFVKKHRANEKISFSVILLGILLEKKIITKRDFINAINSMFEKREWDENLIYLVAKNILEEY